MVTDQVFPDLVVEQELIGAAGGVLDVAQGSHSEVLAAATEADALLTTYFAIDADAIAQLPRCRISARYGIGVDNVDLAAASRAGVVVTNVPDYCVEEVSAHTVAMILALLRKLPQADALVHGGGWGATGLGEVHRISTLTVGLLGYGRIARQVARVLAVLGARILVHDPYLSDSSDLAVVGLDELFVQADVLSVHCPLTTATRGLVGGQRLATMKPSALVVNTSRGPVVIVPDVIEALRTGRLGGAGLDVFDPEPPPPELLRNVPNLLVSPHSAFYSAEAIRESQRKATSQILKHLSGQPVDYPVTPTS